MPIKSTRAFSGQRNFHIPAYSTVTAVKVNGTTAAFTGNFRNVTIDTPCAQGDTVELTFESFRQPDSDGIAAFLSYIPTRTDSTGVVNPPGSAGVTVTGTPQVGQTLTASEVSVWTVGGVAKNFLAASATYNPVPGDVGKTVTATGSTSGATSTATSKVTNAALPSVSPTLTYGARFAMIGDSITQQNDQGFGISADTANGSIVTKSIGEVTQLLTMESRINFDSWYDFNKNASRLTNGANQGINNNRSDQALARFATDVLNMTIDGVIIAIGTNNPQAKLANNVDYQVVSDIKAMITASRNAGKAVIVQTLRAFGIANEGARLKSDFLAINAQLRAYVAGLGDPLVVLWDAYKQLDRGDGYGDPLDYYDSQVHPNARGAELSAWGNDPDSPSLDSLAFAVRRLVQPGSRTADILAANTNFLNNPNFATTTGGALDTGVTSGTAPSGWRFGRKTSSHLSTAAITYEANAATGGNSMVLTFTAQGTNAGEEFDLYAFQINKAGLGSVWVRTFVEVETDGKAWIGSVSPSFLTYESGTATNYANGNVLDSVAPYASRPGVPRRRLIMSDAVLTRAGATAYAPKVTLFALPALATPGDTSVVKIHRVWAAIVPNPKTAWGL